MSAASSHFRPAEWKEAGQESKRLISAANKLVRVGRGLTWHFLPRTAPALHYNALHCSSHPGQAYLCGSASQSRQDSCRGTVDRQAGWLLGRTRTSTDPAWPLAEVVRRRATARLLLPSGLVSDKIRAVLKANWHPDPGQGARSRRHLTLLVLPLRRMYLLAQTNFFCGFAAFERTTRHPPRPRPAATHPNLTVM